MKWLKKIFGNTHNLHIWRFELIRLYENQLHEAGPFMTLVLNEAMHKLKESNIHPKRVENWVVRLERNWRKI